MSNVAPVSLSSFTDASVWSSTEFDTAAVDVSSQVVHCWLFYAPLSRSLSCFAKKTNSALCVRDHPRWSLLSNHQLTAVLRSQTTPFSMLHITCATGFLLLSCICMSTAIPFTITFFNCTSVTFIISTMLLLMVAAPRSSNPDHILRCVHWLKVQGRIEHKVISTTYKLIHSSAHYLHDLITVQPCWSTRSSALVTLRQPSVDCSLKITKHSPLTMLRLTCGTSFLLLFVFIISLVLHHHPALLHRHALIWLLVSSQNLPFLKVFRSIAIYPLLRFIFWNLTTRCLAVTGGGSVGDTWTSPAGFWVQYNIIILTYLV